MRENARSVIKFCQEIGKTPSILTGDSREAAEDLAKSVGINTENVIRPDITLDGELPSIEEL